MTEYVPKIRPALEAAKAADAAKDAEIKRRASPRA